MNRRGRTDRRAWSAAAAGRLAAAAAIGALGMAAGARADEPAVGAQHLTLTPPELALTPHELGLSATTGTFGDPLRARAAHLVRRSDLEAVVHPFGLEPDHVSFLECGTLLANPYRFRILRGGGLSLWHDRPARLQVAPAPIAGVERGGLLAVARADPADHEDATLALDIDIATARIALARSLAAGRADLRLSLGRSTLPSLGDDVLGRSLLVPEIQHLDLDLRLHGDRSTTEMTAGRYKENLARDVGANQEALDGLGVDLDVEENLVTARVTRALGDRHTAWLEIGQDADRNVLRVVDERGRRLADLASDVVRTTWRLATGGYRLGPAEWRVGAELLQRRERLRFARDDVPQHRFPAPAALDFDADWTDGAAFLASSWDRRTHIVEAGVRWEASGGYRGPAVGGSLALASARSRHAWTAGIAWRHGFPGAPALLGRALPVDLGAAPRRRPEQALVAVARFDSDAGHEPWGRGPARDGRRPQPPSPPARLRFGATLLGAHLPRLWVPGDRQRYAAVAGRGRALGLGVDATLRDWPWRRWRVGGDYAFTDAEVAGGAYGDGTRAQADITHRGSVTLDWRPRPWLELGGRLSAASGPVATPVSGRLVVDDGSGEEVRPVMGPVHGEALPASLRLDLRAALAGRLGPVELGAAAELLNAGDRVNAAAWRWNRDFTERRAAGMLPRVLNLAVRARLRR